MRAHFTPQAEIDLEEVGDYIALDNLDALSHSFARYGNTARRLLTDLITTWRVLSFPERDDQEKKCPDEAASDLTATSLTADLLPCASPRESLQVSCPRPTGSCTLHA